VASSFGPEAETTVIEPDAGDRERTAAELLAQVIDDKAMAALADQARGAGVALMGDGGLMQQMFKRFLEASLEGELDAHLGYAKHDPAGRDGGNSRNGRRGKTVATAVGPVEIEVPRDREGSFDPVVVRKRQRRLDGAAGIDGLVLSLSAKGLTTGEIAAHLAEVYGTSVSKETISAITDRVLDAMSEWQARPLDRVYPVVFIDAIRVKIRDGNVVNRPIYLALGVTVDGDRDILGLWAGEHGDGEGAKFWARVLTDLKNRGVQDVLMLVRDGLKGLPDAVNTVWPQTIIQNVRSPPVAQLIPLCEQAGLARAGQGPQAGLYRPVGQSRLRQVRRVQRRVGETLPGHHPPVDRRLGRVRSLPRVQYRNT
jgi:transposase-like protein